MKRLLGLFLSGALFAGSAGIALAQETNKEHKGVTEKTKDATKDAAHGTANAAKKTGKAVKKGTKKGVNKGAEVTRKGAGKVEDKTK